MIRHTMKDMADGTAKKPPILYLELQEMPLERTVVRTLRLLIGLQGMCLAWVLYGILASAFRSPVPVPYFVWIVNFGCLGVFAVLMWLVIRRVLWAIYVQASIATLLAIGSLVGFIMTLVMDVPNPAVRLAYEGLQGLFLLCAAIVGFKYGRLLRSSEAIRLARERVGMANESLVENA